MFDALVKPIMLYCSDFWGMLQIKRNDPSELLPKRNFIDLVHVRFLKQLLGVQTQTSNIGVLLETGRVPLLTQAIKNSVKNWNRIVKMNECNPLVRLSFENMVEKDLDWQRNITLLLNQIGLGDILSGNEPNPEIIVYKRLVDIFQQRVFEEIRQETSKLRTYSLVKKDLRKEPYLETVKNVKDRISMTKFRLSNHNLMIEKGRHLNLPKHERKCPLCFCFEDEKHFLLNCPVFALLENDLITTVERTLKMNNLRRRSSDVILGYLLANAEVAPIVAKYLSKTMEVREFLAETPKRLT